MTQYCIKEDIEALKAGVQGEGAQWHRRRIAANVGDPAVLRRLFGLDPEEFGSFYPDMTTSTPSTLDTISGFLSRYSKGSENNAGGATLRVAPSEPSVADAATWSDGSASSATHPSTDPITQSPNNPILSIPDLIRAGLYEAALQRIIENNLNNPEKSIYFADQTRFLRKLIAIQKMKVGG